MNEESPGRAPGSVEAFGYTQELKRVLGVGDLVILGLSMAVPIAGALVYGYIIGLVNGAISSAYLVAAVGVFFTGNSYARMAAAFPLAGGAYAFVSRGLHKSPGFLVGWAMLGVYLLLLPVLYIFGAYALFALLPDVPLYVWIVTFAIINSFISYRGMEVTRGILKFLLLTELVVYAWFVGAAIIAVLRGPVGPAPALAPFWGPTVSMGAIMAGASIAVWNFGGPDSLTMLAEETKGGIKTVGRGVLISYALLGVLFAGIAYCAALSWPDFQSHSNPDVAFYEIAARIGGPSLKGAFTICVVTAVVFGCSAGVQTCSSRLLYALGRDRMLPQCFSKIHPRYQTPYLGIILMGMVALIVAVLFPNKAEAMTSMINFCLLLVWVSVNVTVVFYYIIGGRSRRYVRDLLAPILGLLLVGYVFLSLNRVALLAGAVWLAVGVLFMAYLRFVRKVELRFSGDEDQ